MDRLCNKCGTIQDESYFHRGGDMSGIEINLRFFDVMWVDVVQLICSAVMVCCLWSVPSLMNTILGLIMAANLVLYLRKRMQETKDVYFIRRVYCDDDFSDEE